jgi:hypothetical protein
VRKSGSLGADSRKCARVAALKLLGDQSLVPAHEGVWRGDGRHRFEACAAKGVDERSEATAFGVA